MTSRKRLEEESNELAGLGMLVNTYAEIAAARMQRVRNFVLANRDYLTDLNAVYRDVKNSYRERVDELKRRGLLKAVSGKHIVHNGKTIYVYISANTGLYGEIIRKTFNLFIAEWVKHDMQSDHEAVIVGRMGMALYKDSGIEHPVTYFDFSDDIVEGEGLRKLIMYLVPFERVVVFYGKFENSVSQLATMSDITGQEEETTRTVSLRPTQYLFEPSLEEIMIFFETEIFASLFIQTLQEAQLAKFASRMVSLDASSEKIRGEVKKLNLSKSRLRHSEMNKRQLNSLTGMILWTGGNNG